MLLLLPVRRSHWPLHCWMDQGRRTEAWSMPSTTGAVNSGRAQGTHTGAHPPSQFINCAFAVPHPRSSSQPSQLRGRAANGGGGRLELQAQWEAGQPGPASGPPPRAAQQQPEATSRRRAAGRPVRQQQRASRRPQATLPPHPRLPGPQRAAGGTPSGAEGRQTGQAVGGAARCRRRRRWASGRYRRPCPATRLPLRSNPDCSTHTLHRRPLVMRSRRPPA